MVHINAGLRLQLNIDAARVMGSGTKVEAADSAAVQGIMNAGILPVRTRNPMLNVIA